MSAALRRSSAGQSAGGESIAFCKDAWVSASAAMPGLPGAQIRAVTAGSMARAAANAAAMKAPI